MWRKRMASLPCLSVNPSMERVIKIDQQSFIIVANSEIRSMMWVRRKHRLSKSKMLPSNDVFSIFFCHVYTKKNFRKIVSNVKGIDRKNNAMCFNLLAFSRVQSSVVLKVSSLHPQEKFLWKGCLFKCTLRGGGRALNFPGVFAQIQKLWAIWKLQILSIFKPSTLYKLDDFWRFCSNYCKKMRLFLKH